MKLIFNFGVFLLAFSLISSCSTFGYQSPQYVKLAHEITANTAKKLEEQKQLYLIGTGGGMMHDIQAMHMSFQFFHEVDLEEARELIVYAVREYLSDINNNEEVRPYLHNYPFTAKNVEIRIFIYGSDRREFSLEKIVYISSRNGVLRYYIRADDDHPIHQERYEEALDKIAFSQGADTVGRNTNEEVIVNEAVAKDGAKAKIIAVSLEHSIYQLNGEGFRPHESLNCISTSCDEVLYFQVKADENGQLLGVGSMPAVIGKSGGICRIDILRDEAPIRMKFPWGSEALKD